MINYSLAKRSVNANLLEINLAKSRIKAATVAGEDPKPEDVALVKTEQQKSFAVAQYSGVMTIEKFAKHIASHGCVYSRADINAILYMAVDEMREQLLEGKKIRLGDLGDFYVSLSSKGVADANDFTAQNITDVKVQWEPGAEFKTLLADAEFQLVASRAAQAKVLKAIKEGKNSVDLDSPDDPEKPDGGGTTPGGTTPGGGSSDGDHKDNASDGDHKGESPSGGGSSDTGGSSTGGSSDQGGTSSGSGDDNQEY